MKTYTFFFVINDTLGYDDDLEKSITGKEGYNILNQQCSDKETYQLPDELELEHIHAICQGLLFNRLFLKQIDPYSEYYQTWIWNHQEEKFT